VAAVAAEGEAAPDGGGETPSEDGGEG